jgi:hypothetical protein
MASSTQAVVAGSRTFALALFAPLTERMGSRPRIAPEPQQALAICAGSPGILIVEYGPPWLPVLQQLLRPAGGQRVIAALPRGQEGAAIELAPLGVELVPWDGQPGPVLAALERLLAGPSGPAAGPVAAPGAPPASTSARDLGDLFSGLGPRAGLGEPGSTAPAASATATVPWQPPAAPPPAAWPGAVPGEDEAEVALVLALRGTLRPEAPLAALAAQTLASLSDLERRALGGANLPFDVKPVCRAAVMRLRTAAALASVPKPPARVDWPALQALLAELDGVLAQVNPLAAEAPKELQGPLEAIRNGLVHEAVDFSEAAQGLEAAGEPAPEALPERPAARPAAATRVLSVGVAQEEAPEARRRRIGPLVALVLLVALGLTYHAWQYLTTAPPVPPPTLGGAPSQTYAFRNENGQFLIALGSKPVDPGELQRFIEQEKKKGNAVRQVAPGRWIVEPEAVRKKEQKP